MPPVAPRGSAPVNPRNITGRTLKAQQDARAKQLEQDAIPLHERLQSEYHRGMADGDRIGVEAFKSAVVKMYQTEGIDAVQEWLEEETAK